MFEQVGLDVVAALVLVGAIGLVVYLLLNNGKGTSKAISKLLPRDEQVPPNSPENK